MAHLSAQLSRFVLCFVKLLEVSFHKGSIRKDEPVSKLFLSVHIHSVAAQAYPSQAGVGTHALNKASLRVLSSN